MNSDFSDDMDILALERELQSLTPAAPSRELVQAIKARMEPVPRRIQPVPPRLAAFPWRRMVAPAAAAAAAVAVMNMDGTRRTTRPGVAVANEPAPAIAWEPMPMLPKYRNKLDRGYVFVGGLDVATGEPNLIPEELVPFYQLQQAIRLPAESAVTRAGFAERRRFIMPAGYDSPGLALRWK